MHPLRHPRNAASVGLLFIASASSTGRPDVRWLARGLRRHDDAPGLGVAMAIMAYVLVAGSTERLTDGRS